MEIDPLCSEPPIVGLWNVRSLAEVQSGKGKKGNYLVQLAGGSKTQIRGTCLRPNPASGHEASPTPGINADASRSGGGGTSPEGGNGAVIARVGFTRPSVHCRAGGAYLHESEFEVGVRSGRFA